MSNPRAFKRTDRVSAQIRRDLGVLVQRIVQEQGLPSVSVSDVEVTRDLAHAKVYVTALQLEHADDAVRGLQAQARELRRRLAGAMRLRHVPELHFHYDDSVDRGERIDELLRNLPGAARSDEAAE